MLKDQYKNFEADDFLKDEFFLQWMQQENLDVHKWWTNWLKEHPQQRKSIENAKKKYNLLRSFTKYQITDKEEKRAWKNLSKRINYPARKILNIHSIRWLSAAAACIALIISLVVYQYYTDGNEHITTATGDIRTVELADGSRIILNKGASLKSYSKIKRQVWIEGQVYFEVNKVKDASERPLPFIVHTGNFDVKVTGTSFLVTSNQNTKNVVLTEGRVSISSNGKSIKIEPGDRIVLNGGKFNKDKVNPALYTAWKDKEFQFNNTTLPELKILIHNIYGLELKVYNEEKLQHRVLNGTLNIASRESFINTIAVLLDSDVRIENNQFVIDPKTPN